MMLNSKSIGNKIAEARKKINLSQAELAQQVSISPQAVGKWERGESMPDITSLNRLAEIFGVDLNFFLTAFGLIKLLRQLMRNLTSKRWKSQYLNKEKDLTGIGICLKEIGLTLTFQG